MRHAIELVRPKTFETFRLPDIRSLQPGRFVERHHQAKELLASEADTQGWDTASAVRLSQVNAALKTGFYPKSFDAKISADWTAKGDFGTWSMSRGGSGSIVFLKIPITKANMLAFGKTTDIKDGSITIQVKLNYLPQPVPADDPKGNPNDLITNPDERSPEDPAVVIQHIDYGETKPPMDQQAMFFSIMGVWFNSNIGLFNYVFNVVSLNQVAQSAQFQWLKPTYTSYAYYDGDKDVPGEDEAYFGVLNMTNNKQPKGLANQLPASAIPDGAGASILIGNRLFLENMVLPAMQAAFPKATTSDFTITNDNTSIQMKNNLDLEKVKVGAIYYQPTATSMIMQVVGDEIQTRMTVHIPISPGIDSYVISETWYRLQLVTKDDGTQTIGWVESRPAIKDSYYKKAEWVVITEVIVAVIGAVAAIVGGAVLTGVTRVIVVIIIGVVAGLAAATPTLIALAISKGAAAALPALTTMLAELTEPVEWPDTAGFLLSQVQLNGSLQLSGAFKTKG